MEALVTNAGSITDTGADSKILARPCSRPGVTAAAFEVSTETPYRPTMDKGNCEQRTFTLAQAVFSLEEIQRIFEIFFQNYHEHMPILDSIVDPISIWSTSSLLFWTIVFIVSKDLPAYNSRTRDPAALSDLIAKTMFNPYSDPLPNMEAFLVLSAWSLPVRRQMEDQRWIYNGIAMQLAVQNGLHLSKGRQTSSFQDPIKHESREVRHTRIWRCWCYSNSLLSCELGFPCQVPFDQRQITHADTAIFRPEFLAKLQIALQVGRCQAALGQSDQDDKDADRVRILRLLEKDLEMSAAPLRLSYLQWTPAVEFLHLSLLLHMYSTFLCGPKPTAASPELQHTAASAASQMIRMFGTAFGSSNVSHGAAKQILTYCPKWYFKFTATAVFVLVKLVYLDRLPADQIREIEHCIRSACASCMVYSSQVGDEYHRTVRVIEVLSRKGVINSALAANQTVTHFGASIHIELLTTATQWRKQNSHNRIANTAVPTSQITPIDAASSRGYDASLNVDDMSNLIFEDDYWATSVDFFESVDMGFSGSTG